MDWNEAREENRKALRHIVALLLALADLAERAAGRSRPVRLLVLWLLRPAEEIARDHVAGLTRNAAGWPASLAIQCHDDSADDAMRLALSFRALAAALAALTAEAFSSWWAGVQVPCIGFTRGAAGTIAGLRDWTAVPAVERRDSS